MKKYIIRASLTLLLILTAVMTINFLSFRTKQVLVVAAPIHSGLNNSNYLQIFSDSLKIPTIANNVAYDAAFVQWLDFVKNSFSDVYKTLNVETINNRSLLLSWKGSNDTLQPILFTAHYDVVPIEPGSEGKWTYPPFAGQIADDYIWGRGALDDKSAVISILSSISMLIKEGFKPPRTIYFAFGADEEVGGQEGAAKIADLLASRNIKPEFILDEGLFVTQGILKGLDGPVALVGIAEKGYLNLKLSISRAGGHSSRPPKETAIGLLSRAVARLEEQPVPARLTAPVLEMFDYLGPEMPSVPRLALANRWLFGPLLKQQLASSVTTNALIRTTGAPTLFNGGIAENVLPTSASAIFNFRLLPGDSVENIVAHARKIINDKRVNVQVYGKAAKPSLVTPVAQASFTMLNRTIKEIFPDALVAPSLLIATTDSQHYSRLSNNIYRFRPLQLNQQDITRFHGINERISIKNFQRSMLFFYQLIKNSNVAMK